MKIALKKDVGELMEKVGAALWFLGKHAFATTLAFVLGAGLVAAILFWQYVTFSPQIDQERAIFKVTFQKELFEELLLLLDQEAAKVEEAGLRTPRDLFNP